MMELQELSRKNGLVLHLSYGKDLFKKLGRVQIWCEILGHLEKWKSNVPKLPEINFDKEPQSSFEEIRDLPAKEYKKLFTNLHLDSLLGVLFLQQLTLELLKEHFKFKFDEGEGGIYRTLEGLCAETINRIR